MTEFRTVIWGIAIGVLLTNERVMCLFVKLNRKLDLHIFLLSLK